MIISHLVLGVFIKASCAIINNIKMEKVSIIGERIKRYNIN
jgi:hypothetical protein